MEIQLESFKESSVKESTADELASQLESERLSIDNLIDKIKNHVAYGSGDLSDDTNKLMDTCGRIQSIAAKLHDKLYDEQ